VSTTTEPDLAPEVATRPRGLRTGWTTGTCASAATKAAVIGLVTGRAPAAVEVGLPGGQRVSFPVESPPDRPNQCVVVKDAGDDPDCTDKARITAHASWSPPDAVEAVTLVAGPGVGTVTRLGLGLPVGAPSITRVPRRMITAAVGEALASAGAAGAVTILFSVPGGEEMAARTSNVRLGIVGGISILGTTGIVRPYSTAAYRASVVQQIDVAAAQGERTVVLATGSRSDAAAQRLYPSLDLVCIVEVGDFTGIALRRAAAAGIKRVVWVGMAGKLAKLAAGVMMTHFRRSAVDGVLLRSVATSTGAPAAVVQAATATATARHFYETCVAHTCLAPLTELCRRAAANCAAHAGDGVEVEVVLVDFEGEHVVTTGRA